MSVLVAAAAALLLAVTLLIAMGSAAAAVATIVVTTSSDTENGDTSSVSALLANPGPDGISLREALQATDNDPGTYSIRFDSSLSGATILVGATCCGELPPLTGGGVSVDGDIDGNGQPDVTLVNRTTDPVAYGFDVVSSGNQLHALALSGFADGVLFTAARFGLPLPQGRTFTGNAVSGLVITGATRSGIRIWPTGPDPGHLECVASACPTDNRWTDTQFVDNTIEAQGDGNPAIDAALETVAGDIVERLTVEGNAIRLGEPGLAINFTAGGGAHADSNRIADVVVAHNTIDAPAPTVGINTWSGFRGGSRNLVEGVKIDDNTIRFTGAPPAGQVVAGIVFAVSDDCYPVGCPPNAVHPKQNVVRTIQIAGNAIEGSEDGILVSDLCCGGPTGSRVVGVRIAGNKIRSTLSRGDANPLGIAIGGGASVSKVVITRNTVVQRAPGPRSHYSAYLAGGGIGVVAGLGKTGGSIRNVVITRSRVDTPLAGITILGGGPSTEAPNGDAAGNHVFGVQLRRNTIVRTPVLATRWNHRVKGINVMGGLGARRPLSGNWPRSTGNSVRCVTLRGNVVAGKRDLVSIFASLGPHARSNTARLGGC